jgi:deoxycytidylate deaminase
VLSDILQRKLKWNLYYNRLLNHPIRSEEPPGMTRQRHLAIAKVNKTTWVGWNKEKTHPEAYRTYCDGEWGATLHAEIDAVLKVPKRLRCNAQVYVSRLRNNGDFAFSKPCINCQKVLVSMGIKSKNIFYTDINGKWKRFDQ